MEQEILIEDGIGGEHMIKYLDEDRVIVQKVTRVLRPEGDYHEAEEYVRYSMPGKVRIKELHSWPYTESLKTQIAAFHAQFPDAK
tara:strand:+ start:541 stop:795 length:255 start_codon:yes stop_codon:yes gene_type:complete